MKRLGFSGTRNGMNNMQREWVKGVLQAGGWNEVHHGGCVGADFDLHVLALAFTDARIFVHPSNLPKKYQAHIVPMERVTILQPLPPLVRNHEIVDVLTGKEDRFIATPAEEAEILRSGTWSTIRYARRRSELHWTVCTRTGLSEFGYASRPE